MDALCGLLAIVLQAEIFTSELEVRGKLNYLAHLLCVDLLKVYCGGVESVGTETVG